MLHDSFITRYCPYRQKLTSSDIVLISILRSCLVFGLLAFDGFLVVFVVIIIRLLTLSCSLCLLRSSLGLFGASLGLLSVIILLERNDLATRESQSVLLEAFFELSLSED